MKPETIEVAAEAAWNLKANRLWFTPMGTNQREFVGDDYEPMGHLLTVKIPPSVAEILKPAWDEHSKPPLFAGA